MRRFIPVLVLFVVLNPATWADNWPAWRGPQNTGISAESNLPVTWSKTKNIRWQAPLPEPGNSTPIIWDNYVFITQSLNKGKQRALISFRRDDGKKLWQRTVACNVKESTHRQNPPCSSSPVTDGSAVYAHFASAGVVAYDFHGKELWHRDLGPVLHKWGNGSSPILYKNLLIVFHGPGEPTFLIALDKHTGKTVWKKEETAINSPIFGSWSTPIILRVGNRDELILPLPGNKIGGPGEFKGYDPVTGNELWRCKGLGNEIYAMPVVSAKNDLVIGISGHNGPLLAIRPGGNGDVTQTHKVWHVNKKNPQRIGSGILLDGRLYLSNALGVVECVDAANGNLLWEQRVDGKLWGSMLVADGKLYVTNLEGTTFVLAPGPKFQLLAKNELNEETYAALAVASGDLFLRTHKHLYCIGSTK